MKKIATIICVLALASSSLFAQETLRDVVRDYQRNNPDFTMVIPSFLIKTGLAFGEMEEDDREVLKLIDDMKIVISDNKFYKSDLSALEDGIKQGKFVELMTVMDQGDKVRMILNEKSKKRSEMLMLVESDDENVMMLFNFHGKPDFNKFIDFAN